MVADFNPKTLRCQMKQTPVVLSTLAGTQIGNNIEDDKVRYVYGYVYQNTDAVGAHILTFWAGDAIFPLRRNVYSRNLAIAEENPYPLVQDPDSPLFRVAPNTGVAPVQENQIYCTDEVGNQINVSLLYYDKRV